MKHIFIVNPISGKNDAGKTMVPAIIEAAAARALSYEIEITREPKHATRLAAQYAENGGPVRLYAVGGDGTLNEVMAGAYPYKNAAVAAVPVGSGNDYVRNFGVAEDFLNIAQLLEGRAIPVDLMKVDHGISLAITSVGLDADVAYGIPKYRRVPALGGSMAYNASIIENLLKPIGKRVRITIDGRATEGTYLIATVCNGQTYGGGYRAAPEADLQDGVLDIILVKKISRLSIAGIIGKYKQGKHFSGGKIIPSLQNMIEHFTGHEVDITPLDKKGFILNEDGECGPAPRLHAKVMPLAAAWKGKFVE
ncbi:MAG: diacylglycerol/lipid kinase family protein [Oscillospiraceae bacterium]